MEIASGHEDRQIEILLPPETGPKQLLVNGVETEFSLRRIEGSVYVCFAVQKLGALSVQLWLDGEEKAELAKWIVA